MKQETHQPVYDEADTTSISHGAVEQVYTAYTIFNKYLAKFTKSLKYTSFSEKLAIFRKYLDPTVGMRNHLQVVGWWCYNRGVCGTALEIECRGTICVPSIFGIYYFT